MLSVSTQPLTGQQSTAAASVSPMVLLSRVVNNQVLTKALQVWGLVALNIDSEEVTKAEEPFEAQKEAAFICNLQVGNSFTPLL